MSYDGGDNPAQSTQPASYTVAVRNSPDGLGLARVIPLERETLPLADIVALVVGDENNGTRLVETIQFMGNRKECPTEKYFAGSWLLSPAGGDPSAVPHAGHYVSCLSIQDRHSKQSFTPSYEDGWLIVCSGCC